MNPRVTDKHGYLLLDDRPAFYNCELARCLECGAIGTVEGGGLSECRGPFAVYAYRCTEDNHGNQLHPLRDQETKQ